MCFFTNLVLSKGGGGVSLAVYVDTALPPAVSRTLNDMRVRFVGGDNASPGDGYEVQVLQLADDCDTGAAALLLCQDPDALHALLVAPPPPGFHGVVYHTLLLVWQQLRELGHDAFRSHAIVLLADATKRPPWTDLLRGLTDVGVFFPDQLVGRDKTAPDAVCLASAVMGYTSITPPSPRLGGLTEFVLRRFNVASERPRRAAVGLMHSDTPPRLANQDDVLNSIRETLPRFEVSLLRLDNAPFLEQVTAVLRVSVLVGMCNQHMGVAMFMHHGAAVVLLHPYRVRLVAGNDSVSTLAEQGDMGLHFWHWDNTDPRNTVVDVESSLGWAIGGINELLNKDVGEMVGDQPVTKTQLLGLLEKQLTRVPRDAIGALLRQVVASPSLQRHLERLGVSRDGVGRQEDDLADEVDGISSEGGEGD